MTADANLELRAYGGHENPQDKEQGIVVLAFLILKVMMRKKAA